MVKTRGSNSLGNVFYRSFCLIADYPSARIMLAPLYQHHPNVHPCSKTGYYLNRTEKRFFGVKKHVTPAPNLYQKDNTKLRTFKPEYKPFASDRMIDFKVPKKIVILSEIPKGATGKLQRIGLAETLGLT